MNNRLKHPIENAIEFLLNDKVKYGDGPQSKAAAKHLQAINNFDMDVEYLQEPDLLNPSIQLHESDMLQGEATLAKTSPVSIPPTPVPADTKETKKT